MPMPAGLGTRLELGKAAVVDVDPEQTTYFSGGGLTFGVEYRELNAAALDAAAGDDPVKKEAAARFRHLDEVGVSVHVFDSANEEEYLRFDGFTGLKHFPLHLPGQSPHPRALGREHRGISSRCAPQTFCAIA